MFSSSLSLTYRYIKDLMSETPPVESISPPKWVNVKDNLPSTYTQYLVHITNGQRGYFEALYWNPYQEAWSGLIHGHTVTHWMELPSAPLDGANR